MSTQKRNKSKLSKGTNGKSSKENPKVEKKHHEDGIRETFDSIVIAFILAILFRTFEAEAFVIPTGSMAPTLYGRNKDVDCPQCGLSFAIGASTELNQATGFLGNRIQNTHCPSCRNTIDVYDNSVFNGDRILVTKFSYDFASPKRFDVLVFKFPENPNTSYIKRLIGLPGESIKLSQGDVFARKQHDEPWQMLRKDNPDKQRNIQLIVYDNNHRETKLHEQGWPARWTGMTQAPGVKRLDGWSPSEQGWKSIEEGAAFEVDATSSEKPEWLRYRNIVPTPETWQALEDGETIQLKEPELIFDHCSYNAMDFGRFWVGDLTVSCDVEINSASDKGELVLELNEGVRQYRCRFDLGTGEVNAYLVDHTFLTDSGEEERLLGTADTGVVSGDAYNLRLANVDNRLCLWVDDSLIEFDQELVYESPSWTGPQERDLVPVGIAANQAKVNVNNLLLERDIYYRAEKSGPAFADPSITGGGERGHHYDQRADPEAYWKAYGSGQNQYLVYEKLAEDEYFVMGDNSPKSSDSRLWGNGREADRRHAVKEASLVGKAFYVYWPHGVPFGNDGKGFGVRYHRDQQSRKTDYPSFEVPFYPQVDRMRRIR